MSLAKTVLFFSALTVGAFSLAAQSTGRSPAASAPPPVENILTIIGANIPGLPCLDCLIGITDPAIGLPAPLGTVVQGSIYQVDAVFVDNSYTGLCTFTFALKDVNKSVIKSVSQTQSEVANTTILASALLTVPSNATIGLGSVTTTAVCGSTTTNASKSPAYIACSSNPPHCTN